MTDISNPQMGELNLGESATRALIKCNFCGAHQKDAKVFIQGKDGYICNNCILMALDALVQQVMK